MFRIFGINSILAKAELLSVLYCLKYFNLNFFRVVFLVFYQMKGFHFSILQIFKRQLPR